MSYVNRDCNQLRQEDMVLNHLKAHGKISQLQALRSYGCMRLADVVWKLRAHGHAIETTWRHQGGKRYAVYRLENGVEGA